MRFLHEIRVGGLLSFGEGVRLELGDLNVLIGPNGSGKSNLLEVLRLLRAVPTDIHDALAEGGGIDEWLWKGEREGSGAHIEVVVCPKCEGRGELPLRYHLGIGRRGETAKIANEWLADSLQYPGHSEPRLYVDAGGSGRVLPGKAIPRLDEPDETPCGRWVQPGDPNWRRSVLAERRNPGLHPEIAYVAEQFSQIRLYTQWNLGRGAAPRVPQPIDLPDDFLLEDASNLGLVMNDLQRRGVLQTTFIGHLREFYEGVRDISVGTHDGRMHLYLHEQGLIDPVPAMRLSDGTLKYLCLLAVLCHPSPPPLVCIEGPEAGLHPDAMSLLAGLLLEASTRTQLIVATHSDALVNALSDHPESVIVCERDVGGTNFRRLDADRLTAWLQRYSLGELWRKGELGGNPW